ncbi:MAG: hypothetical protein JO153_07470 [Solirubrobacterales bacterium]|nr:hypothetical protein [Solirubrobacterales bacterium]MBV9916326.1 hypothetical protein [Solirubrobacterales bacterium]
MKEVHIVVGALAIGLSAGAGLLGAWCWWRASPNPWFWRLLRSSQVVVVLEAALGGVLELTDRKAPGIHVVYGLLPLAVSFIGEQLRVVSAQMILDARGIPSAAAVGELPAEDQQRVVVAIVQREIGVMALAALVIVVLLARAAGTA